MKKLLLIVLMMIMTIMAFGEENKISNEIQDKMDFYMAQFYAEKITYNGQQGFFVPAQGWKNIELSIRELVYNQELLVIKEKRIKDLNTIEEKYFKLKTGLAVSISFNVGVTFLAAGLGVLLYSIGR